MAPLLDQELNRVLAFKDDPAHSPTADFPQVRWIQLRASKLWVSPGELSAMGTTARPRDHRHDACQDADPGPAAHAPDHRAFIAYRPEYGDTERERNRMTLMKGAAGVDPKP